MTMMTYGRTSSSPPASSGPMGLRPDIVRVPPPLHHLSPVSLIAKPNTSNLGWLPTLCVVSASGLLILAVADTAARNGHPSAEPLFWIGFLLLFVPAALRVLSLDASRTERIGTVLIVGLGLFFMKMLHSPTAFTFFDEFSHYRTVDDILQSNRLFRENPLAVISPLYPGLQIATAAVVDLTGLDIFPAAGVILIATRFVLVLALFHLSESIGMTSREASIAVLLYAANPNFVYFGAEYMYESIALPLMVMILYAVARREHVAPGDRLGWTVTALVGVVALVVTHHLTAFGLALFLGGWTIIRGLVYFRRPNTLPGLAWVTGVVLSCVVGWLALVARETVGYLGSVFDEAAKSIVELVAQEETAKQPFQSSTGAVAPVWERLTGFGSVGLILLVLPFGLWHVWHRGGDQRYRALILFFALVAASYPVTLALRLTQAGTETSSRASEFLFMAIAFVFAMTIGERWIQPRGQWTPRRRRPLLHAVSPLAVTAGIVVLIAGGVIVGWAPYARMPGPYLVGADPRSVEPEGIAAAQWFEATIAPDNRVLADRTNRQLIGSIGRQTPQVRAAGSAHVSELVFATSFGASERAIIRSKGLRYVVTDRRLSMSRPFIGIYFELSEPNAYSHEVPISPKALGKFDGIVGVSRVFDSGNLVVYDVRALLPPS